MNKKNKTMKAAALASALAGLLSPAGAHAQTPASQEVQQLMGDFYAKMGNAASQLGSQSQPNTKTMDQTLQNSAKSAPPSGYSTAQGNISLNAVPVQTVDPATGKTVTTYVDYSQKYSQALQGAQKQWDRTKQPSAVPDSNSASIGGYKVTVGSNGQVSASDAQGQPVAVVYSKDQAGQGSVYLGADSRDQLITMVGKQSGTQQQIKPTAPYSFTYLGQDGKPVTQTVSMAPVDAAKKAAAGFATAAAVQIPNKYTVPVNGQNMTFNVDPSLSGNRDQIRQTVHQALSPANIRNNAANGASATSSIVTPVVAALPKSNMSAAGGLLKLPGATAQSQTLSMALTEADAKRAYVMAAGDFKMREEMKELRSMSTGTRYDSALQTTLRSGMYYDPDMRKWNEANPLSNRMRWSLDGSGAGSSAETLYSVETREYAEYLLIREKRLLNLMFGLNTDVGGASETNNDNKAARQAAWSKARSDRLAADVTAAKASMDEYAARAAREPDAQRKALFQSYYGAAKTFYDQAVAKRSSTGIQDYAQYDWSASQNAQNGDGTATANPNPWIETQSQQALSREMAIVAEQERRNQSLMTAQDGLRARLNKELGTVANYKSNENQGKNAPLTTTVNTAR